MCLYCFDEEAAAKGIPYAWAITEFCFAGRGATFGFTVSRYVEKRQLI